MAPLSVYKALAFLTLLIPGIPAKQNAAHVVYATDGAECISLVVSVRSLIANTASPDRLVVHIFHTNYTRSYRQCLECNGFNLSPIPLPGHVILHDIDLDWIKDDIRVALDRVSRLKALATYARLLVAETLIHQTDTSLYLDCDTIVLGDAVKMIDNWQWKKGSILAACNYKTLAISTRLMSIAHERYGLKKKARDEMTFNTGVLLFNHPNWLARNATQEVVFLMKANSHSKQHLWKLGVQPPIQAVAHNHWQVLPDEWNFSGLGKPDAKQYDMDTIMSQSVLHWAGSFNKPWSEDPNFFDAWIKYLLPEDGRVCRCVAEDPRSNSTLIKKHLKQRKKAMRGRKA
eukprot:TRINITY_DN9283_c0_g1_i2.p1 TRINITY_DN9283_c0_g1~~TRINITY_DN9283_c0_g1_i2.p1  ORF type:complete len:345 (+),score=72.12 TRINITY_DN9283_c0_g1_i2:228-1262(+)